MLRGSCLCGGIQIEITGAHSGVAQCHCGLCRKASGTGAIAHIMVPSTGVRWVSGRELVSTYTRPSGYGTEFCGRCGCPAPDAGPQNTRVPVGLIDGRAALTVSEHIFVASKASWEVIGDNAPQYDGDGPARTDLEAFDAAVTGR